MPAITVLMAVHNGEQFLAETLASVATQTFEDYEFLIVDDASSDQSAVMLAQAAQADKRIRILTNETNLGLTKSLNRGLEAAEGDFIARIDADDVCLPDRLAVQIEHMRQNPELVGITSGYALIDDKGRVLGEIDDALDSWQVQWLLGWNPPAPHPTYFFRRCPNRSTPIAYDEQFRTAQDFDLWARLSQMGATERLGQVLIQYRRHAGAITHSKRHEQAQNCAAIGRRVLAARYPAEVVSKLETLVDLFSYNAPANAETIKAAVDGANAMIAHDRAEAGEHYHWMKQMLAGLLGDAILSRAGALSSPSAMAAFAWYAREFLPDLARAALRDPTTALKSLRNRKRG